MVGLGNSSRSVRVLFRRVFELYLIANLFITPSLSINGESRLVKDLFRNYSREARPVINDNTNVTLKLGIALHQLIEVKEKLEFFSVSLFVRQLWQDEQLVWDPANYSNVKSINLSPGQVWLPDLVLYNNVDEDKSFGGSLDQLNNRIIVSHDGSMKWLTPAIFRAKCAMDVEFFPFDTQHCSLKFGSWTYNGFQIDLIALNSEVDFGPYTKHSEWLITEGHLSRNVVKYNCCPEPFPDITVTFTMKRRSLFYLMNLIFPMVVISMLTMLSFYLPSESGERIALAITLLLAMTVFMLIVGEIIPPTSDSIPLVAVFFSSVMAEMVFMVIILCYILKLHFKDEKEVMPRWMRYYILDRLSYTIGIRSHSKKGMSSSDFGSNKSIGGGETLGDKVRNALELKKINESNGFYNNGNDSVTSVTFVNNGVLHRHGGELTKTFENCFMNGKEETEQAVKKSPSGTTQDGSMISSGKTEMIRLNNKLDLFLEKILHEEEVEHRKYEWRICALTIDRLSLFMFGVIFLVTTLGIFMRAPGYVG